MGTPDRAPTRTWLLRGDPERGHVCTEVDDGIWIVAPDPSTPYAHRGAILVSRKDARLIAKRLTQCLDATAKR